MVLKPLPQSKIECIRLISDQIIEELNVGERSSVEDFLFKLAASYTGPRNIDAFVDDFENPKHFLVLGNFPGIVTMGGLTAVIIIYSSPEERSPENNKVMLKTIENYAAIKGTGEIIASSWKYKGARGIDSMWEDAGYEIQETTYVKRL